jgi:integrase
MKRRGNNEGTIVKRGSSYRAQITIDGKRFSRTFKTRREAQEWLAGIIRTYGRLTGLSALDNTLNDLVERYIAIREPDWSPETITQYNRLYNLYIRDTIGKTKLERLTPVMLQNFYMELAKERGNRSAVITHSIVRAALRMAVRNNIIPMNPAEGVSIPTKKKIKISVWTSEQVRTFLEGAKGHRDEALYWLAFATGARVSELIALTWGDVNSDRKSVTISKQLTSSSKREKVFRETKSRHSRREITLPDVVMEKLAYQHERCRQIYGREPQKDDLVFPEDDGLATNRHIIYHRFWRLVNKLGLPTIRFHDIRHTVASMLLTSGVPIPVVSNMLGHSSPTITMGIYAHFIPGTNEIATEAIDRMLRA